MIKLIGHHIGVSIISTLTISLFVALLFIPMATYLLLRKKNGQSVFYEKGFDCTASCTGLPGFAENLYAESGSNDFGAIIVLFVTLILSIYMNVQQMKDVNTDRINIYVTMPTGSTLDNADKLVKVIEARLDSFPGRKDLISRINEKNAVLTLNFTDDFVKKAGSKMAEYKATVQATVSNIQGAEISVEESMSGGGGGVAQEEAMAGLGNFMRLLGIGENRERIVIKGSDFDVMQLVAEDFRYYLDEQEFIRGSRVSYNRRQPEIHLDFDPILLTSYEITRANISSGLAALNPEYSSGTSFKIGEDTYDIIIRNDIPGDEENEEEEAETEKKDKTVDDLRRVQIQNANGGLHDLHNLASVNYGRDVPVSCGSTRINR